MAEQQVQLTDLDAEQLQQVKKQLDEVSAGGGREGQVDSGCSTAFLGGGTSACQLAILARRTLGAGRQRLSIALGALLS